MAERIVDISVLGVKELERALARLPAAAQKKAVRPAIREVAKMSREDIVGQIRALGLIRSGRLLRAWQVEIKPIAGKRRARRLQVVLPLPTRAQMLLAPGEFYYPVAVEYGSSASGKTPGNVPPKPYIRRGTDARMPAKRAAMVSIIGKNVQKEFRKLVKA